MNTFNRRQLRFRAWFEKIEQMAHMDDALLPNWDSPILGELIYRHNNVRSADKDNVILMQSTGFLDSDDGEIYDGDVLAEGKSDDLKVLISWSYEYGIWVCTDGTGGENPLWEVLDIPKMRVIGNVFENPELLNKPEEEENGKRAS